MNKLEFWKEEDKDEYNIRKGMFRNYCVIDGLNKKDLEILYDEIGKVLGKTDWKKEMEEDKKKYID